MGCHSLLQGIFLTQGLNPGLLLCGQTLYPTEPPGKAQASASVSPVESGVQQRLCPVNPLQRAAASTGLKTGRATSQEGRDLSGPAPRRPLGADDLCMQIALIPVGLVKEEEGDCSFPKRSGPQGGVS